MKDKHIDWNEPWKVYDEYLPPKTTDQMIMFLMEEQLGLDHNEESDGIRIGKISELEKYQEEFLERLKGY